MMPTSKYHDTLYLVALGLPLLLLGAGFSSFQGSIANTVRIVAEKLNLLDGERGNSSLRYTRNIPLVFIGGMPRSGTTLMRAILDAHTAVRCGEETHIIPRILGFREMLFQTEKEAEMLVNGGVTTRVMQSAFAAFLLEIIIGHSEPADRLCNKDPFTMRYAHYVSELFPNAKFLWVVRDGRAVCHSIISRQINIKGYGMEDYNLCLTKWNSAVEVMLAQCRLVNVSRCRIVYYEQLVAEPRLWLEDIVQFLDLPWEDSLMQHEKFIGLPGGVSVSPTEKSSDQVIRPIHKEALYSWVEKIPSETKTKAAELAPMLQQLGYNAQMFLGCYDSPMVNESYAGDFRNQANQEWESSWLTLSRTLIGNKM